MTTNIVEIRVVNAVSWKLKVLKVVLKFLNWCTIPNSHRESKEIVINVKFDIE